MSFILFLLIIFLLNIRLAIEKNRHLNFHVKNKIKLSHSGWILIIIASSLLFSCRSTKYVPENQYLLKNYKIGVDNKKIKTKELDNFVRQRPNKRILGVRFFLGLYNLSNKDKTRWPHSWLRKIGEEPVIYDPFATERTTRQFEIFMRNKGFYSAETTDTVIKDGRKVRVLYQVTTNEPHRIRKIFYNIEDTSLVEIILADSARSFLKPNKIFDVDLLQEERARIETRLKNRGYYNFTREYVFFTADSTAGDKIVDLTIGIKKFLQRVDENEFELREHPRYKLNHVHVYMNFDPRASLTDPEQYLGTFDTISYRNMVLFYRGEIPVKPRVIAQSTFINPGDYFSQENVDRTYRNFFGLRLYRLINIRFRESVSTTDTLNTPLLDCVIQLTPASLQSYTLEVEGTNSSGDIGFGGNLLYQNRNLLGGAEIFDIKLKGGFETLREDERSAFQNTYEYGIEGNLRIPKFMLPIRSVSFIQKYNPQTNFTLAYNYQRRPDYTRTIANFSFGYQWKGNNFTTHIIKPVEFNFVQLPYATEAFLDLIRGTFLEYSYQDHLISETNYSFIFNNQDIRRTRDFMFFRFNIEFAGNTLSAFNNLTNANKVDGAYQLLGTEFAQFFRNDIDFRYYKRLKDENLLVYRFFAGIGLPYGNSRGLPFEKKYFAGGANSIRAWQVRSLGPGSYFDETDISFPNRNADLKLETNIEYRFDLFWVLKGALFLDAGNIWAINNFDEREGAVFYPGKFYKDIAIGTGLGTRFDFSFFIFRLDLGMKLRNPAENEGNRWIPWDRKLNFRKDFVLNIGIGYPF
jgi:outer membrane protein assembly factor BamA